MSDPKTPETPHREPDAVDQGEWTTGGDATTNTPPPHESSPKKPEALEQEAFSSGRRTPANGVEPREDLHGESEEERQEERQEERVREARIKRRRERREALKTKKGRFTSAFQVARKVALIGFAVIGAYLLAVYIDLLFKVFFLKHINFFTPFLQRYLVTPLAFEGGFFVATLVMLYLLGRFVDLALWPTLLSMVLLLHLFDFGVKFVLAQSAFNYNNWRLWLLRAPVILLTVLLGRSVLKWALLREE